MGLGRYGTFAGGIDLLDEKHATINSAIQPYVFEGPLRVPLAPCGLEAAVATVQPGQTVERWQRIAVAAGGWSVDVFSPVQGRVLGVGLAEVAAGDGFVSCPVVEIDPDQTSFEFPQAEASFNWQTAGPDDLRHRLEQGGLTVLRHRTGPLRRWIAHARRKECRTLIGNCMENQPYVTSDHRLLVEHPCEVMAGLAILGRAIESPEVVLAVDHRRTADYQGIIAPARRYEIGRVALSHKYPTGADPILVKVLTRREMPPGGSVMDTGTAVTNAATCLAAYMWVACGIPPVGRVVTAAGPRATRSGNYWAPFGAACVSLVGQAGQPVIHNGPMVGIRCGGQAVVSPATDAVLALESAVPASPSPCIRCSWCTDHCPARLNVAALNDAFEVCDLSLAHRLAAQACVECGVCSYVCPARLPLSQRARQLKRILAGIESTSPLLASMA